jgi:hypothetical protein
MAFRLVTLNQYGKITRIYPKAYTDFDIPEFGDILNRRLYAYIDEAYLPTGAELLALENAISPNEDFNIDGSRIIQNIERNTFYDPRVEVILGMQNPYPYLSFNSPIVQDITKTTVVYNTNSSATKPTHSTTVKKFGTSSGKFTRDAGGATGGFVYVTNIVKRSSTLGGAAPHNRLGVGSTSPTIRSSYGFEMFFYPTSLSNNFTLLQKGPTGASANWKLSFDSAAGFLQFAWQTDGTTSGYNQSQNIVNAAGISLNTWNHVAVSIIKTGVGGASANADISGYFNTTRRFTLGVTTSTIPENNDTNGIYVGNNHLGSESFNGYIDSLRVFDAESTGGFVSAYGFYPYGGNTLTGVPTLAGFSHTSQDICFVMNFNNLDGYDAFFAESTDYLVGIVSRLTDLTFLPSGNVGLATTASVGVRDVYRHQRGLTGVTAYADATGFSLAYGPISRRYFNPFPLGTTLGNVVDYDYSFNLTSITDSALTLQDFINHYNTNVKFENMLERSELIQGAYGDRGSSGNAFDTLLGRNPFGRLFSQGDSYGYTSGSYNSLFINPFDNNTLNYILTSGLLATQGICLSSYRFTDGLNFDRMLTAQQISNLRLDLLDYYARLDEKYRSVKREMVAATTKSGVKNGKTSGGTKQVLFVSEEPDIFTP